jgi:AraC-like DNA-binding protein
MFRRIGINRKLSALVDCNFSEYLRKYRLSKAKLNLESGIQITECSCAVGFSSPSYFVVVLKLNLEFLQKRLLLKMNIQYEITAKPYHLKITRTLIPLWQLTFPRNHAEFYHWCRCLEYYPLVIANETKILAEHLLRFFLTYRA